MRVGVLMLVLGAALVGGCGAEKRPVVGEDDFTAAHLRNLDEPSALRVLEPTEEERRALAEEAALRADVPAGQEGWSEDSDLEEAPTQREKWEGASIAVLQVAVTIGAMVAPYFLF